MADKELYSKEIGPEVDVDLVLKDGTQVALVIKYGGAGGGAELTAYVKAEYFLEKLKALIPGQLDDVIIDVAVGQFVKP